MLPEILKIGYVSISGYSFFYLVGILAYATVFLILARRERLDLVECFNFILLGVVSAILGAKIYGVFYLVVAAPTSLVTLKTLWQEFKTGGVFYGGAISGLIFSFFYIRKYFKGKEWRVADITVIGVALGHAFGRIGCFCAGCCYGHPTQLPWGVNFSFHSGKPHPYKNVLIHPTQIYEALLNFLNFLILFFVWRKRKFTGQVFSLYLINYGIIRFFVEIFRYDGGRGYLLRIGNPIIILSYPQLISTILIACGIYFYRTSNHA